MLNKISKKIEANHIKISFILFKILLTFIFIQAGIEKILTASTPEWFIKQFESTFLAFVPGGLSVLFYSLGFLETITGLVLFTSIIKLKNKSLNSMSLILSELCFLFLGVGLRVSHQYTEAAHLFFYFTITFLIYTQNE